MRSNLFALAVILASASSASAAPPPGLVQALDEGDSAKVAALLTQGADPNGDDGFGWTLLARAAAKGSAEVVKVLLDRARGRGLQGERRCREGPARAWG
ncbi:MAG: ankyrin repeat domain-containing protein [Elusimicrobia bacterium]|nr:ankyrin repeat domain-containing protein [Elusimicrobiota bacterium]